MNNYIVLVLDDVFRANVLDVFKCNVCVHLFCLQVWLSVDGGNFFMKIYKFASPTDSPPIFTSGYRYESGIWAILTRHANADDRVLCIGKTGKLF